MMIARLPAEELRKVTAEHIWSAAQKTLRGLQGDPFGESTGYAPKAVFGVAATEALGFKVLPGAHFSGGVRTPCFRALRNAGYLIAPKGQTPALEATLAARRPRIPIDVAHRSEMISPTIPG